VIVRLFKSCEENGRKDLICVHDPDTDFVAAASLDKGDEASAATAATSFVAHVLCLFGFCPIFVCDHCDLLKALKARLNELELSDLVIQEISSTELKDQSSKRLENELNVFLKEDLWWNYLDSWIRKRNISSGAFEALFCGRKPVITGSNEVIVRSRSGRKIREPQRLVAQTKKNLELLNDDEDEEEEKTFSKKPRRKNVSKGYDAKARKKKIKSSPPKKKRKGNYF